LFWCWGHPERVSVCSAFGLFACVWIGWAWCATQCASFLPFLVLVCLSVVHDCILCVRCCLCLSLRAFGFFVVLGFLRFRCVFVCEAFPVDGRLLVACVSASVPQQVVLCVDCFVLVVCDFGWGCLVSASDPERVVLCVDFFCSYWLCFWLGMFVDAFLFLFGTGRF